MSEKGGDRPFIVGRCETRKQEEAQKLRTGYPGEMKANKKGEFFSQKWEGGMPKRARFLPWGLGNFGFLQKGRSSGLKKRSQRNSIQKGKGGDLHKRVPRLSAPTKRKRTDDVSTGRRKGGGAVRKKRQLR